MNREQLVPPVIQSCREYVGGRPFVRYPSWVLNDPVSSSSCTDSGSEFQNLFRLIQKNEFTSDTENDDKDSHQKSGMDFVVTESMNQKPIENKTSEKLLDSSLSTSSFQKKSGTDEKKSGFFGSMVSSLKEELNENIGKKSDSYVDISNIKQGRTSDTSSKSTSAANTLERKKHVTRGVRTMARPTLFVKKPGVGQADMKPESEKRRRSTKYSMGLGKDNLASMSIIMLQSSQVETVEPKYRTKNRIVLPVMPENFNKIFSPEVMKITDRIRKVFHSNNCIINDPDVSNALQSKFEKMYQNKISVKRKALELPRRFWYRENKLELRRKMSSKKSFNLTKQLDFSMPHRNFSNDIHRYVKRLMEIAEYMNSDAKLQVSKDRSSVYDSLPLETSFVKAVTTDYRLIPTFKTYEALKEQTKLVNKTCFKSYSEHSLHLSNETSTETKSETKSEKRSWFRSISINVLKSIAKRSTHNTSTTSASHKEEQFPENKTPGN